MNTTNPYAQNPTMPAGLVEERTSVLAIVALVCALVCFIPGLGLLGAILGVVALVMIGGAGGRLGGRGLAIAAIILGLLFSALWIGAYVGLSKFGSMAAKMMGGTVDSFMTAAESGDLAGARQTLDPTVQSAITDADITRFTTGYQSQLGKYKGVPKGIMAMAQGYGQAGPIMQKFQGQNNGIIPVPVEFERGWGVVAIQINPNSPPSGGVFVPMNLTVHASPTQSWMLYDPAASTPATPDAPNVPDAPPASGTP